MATKRTRDGELIKKDPRRPIPASIFYSIMYDWLEDMVVDALRHLCNEMNLKSMLCGFYDNRTYVKVKSFTTNAYRMTEVYDDNPRRDVLELNGPSCMSDAIEMLDRVGNVPIRDDEIPVILYPYCWNVPVYERDSSRMPHRMRNVKMERQTKKTDS